MIILQDTPTHTHTQWAKHPLISAAPVAKRGVHNVQRQLLAVRGSGVSYTGQRWRMMMSEGMLLQHCYVDGVRGGRTLLVTQLWKITCDDHWEQKRITWLSAVLLLRYPSASLSVFQFKSTLYILYIYFFYRNPEPDPQKSNGSKRFNRKKPSARPWRMGILQLFEDKYHHIFVAQNGSKNIIISFKTFMKSSVCNAPVSDLVVV